MRIDTYVFDQYVENNGYNKLLFLDGMGVKLSIDIYIFDEQFQKNRCNKLDTYVFFNRSDAHKWVQWAVFG